MFKQFTVTQLGLLLNGLQSTFVADNAKEHADLAQQIEKELASRGLHFNREKSYSMWSK